MIKFIIDRFEENHAILEDDNGESLVVLKKILPTNSNEGDVLIFDNIPVSLHSSDNPSFRKLLPEFQAMQVYAIYCKLNKVRC